MTKTLSHYIYQYDEDYLNKKTNSNYQKIRCVMAIILLGITLWSLKLAVTIEHSIFYIITVFLGIISLAVIQHVISNHTREKRLNFILNTPMPSQLWRNQEFRQLPLTSEQKQLIEAGLKDFFILHVLYPKRPIAMPSKAIDKLWHAFILDTKNYESYCKRAFGSTFHHVPDYEFSDKGKNIQLFTWQSVCRLQGIRPANPTTMPRLFGADALILGGILMGSDIWLSQMNTMAMSYQSWHASNFSSSSDGGGGDIGSASGSYDDSCDVGITSDGDCSCGGSGDSGSCGGGGDGGSCGGGCGGGGCGG